jgi:hypothetical protein
MTAKNCLIASIFRAGTDWTWKQRLEKGHAPNELRFSIFDFPISSFDQSPTPLLTD